MRSEFAFRPTISKEEISELPVRHFQGEIFYIDTYEKFMKVNGFLKNEKVLGFDTETRPSFKKGATNGVSLLQLSTVNKAFLFRINKIGLPEELKSILSSDEILKIGVAIHDDLISLKKVAHFVPAGFIDLQHIAKDYGIEEKGLKKLAAIVLGFKISKRQQTSNWEAEVLSQPQIEYAATDAWVCYEIYNRLMQ
ncbi:MAG: 3'-5' exonuclease domain-containing protein 2 [Bacteroidales bacterium]|nr:3'-5' exonuclease domain-containing protein 2 [Bacteroidales bacterium]